MELEVKRLIAHGKYAGNFSFDYLPPENLCLVPLCKIGEVKVTGVYEICDDDSVEIKLTVNYFLSGQCSYCLNDAEKEISYTGEVLFVPENDDENYYYDGNKINLKTAVDDAILMSQPHVLLCKEDCKGIDVT